MAVRNVARKVLAKELSPALRRRYELAPDEKINTEVTRQSGATPPRGKDPWAEIRGMLSRTQADQILRAIHKNRRSKNGSADFDFR